MLPTPLKSVSQLMGSLRNFCASASVLEAIDASELPDGACIDSESLGLLAREAQALGSPQLRLGLALLEFRRVSEPRPEHWLQLMQAYFDAGRFHDVLQLQQRVVLTGEQAWILQLASAYRLGDWPAVIDTANLLEPASLPFGLQALIIRAGIELGHFGSPRSLLASLQPDTTQQLRQLALLLLLHGFRHGVATPEQALQLLALNPQLQQTELAAFLRFWPQLVDLVAGGGGDPARLQRLHRQSWQRLARPRILSSPDGDLQSCPKTSSGWRIALILPNGSNTALQQWHMLQQHLSLQQPQLELIPVVLYAGGDAHHAFPSCGLDLSACSPLQRLVKLRAQGFDGLLDTVGPFDPVWLVTVAQRVAPLQVAWFPVPLSLPAASPFDAQLADRWTQLPSPEPDSVPWLTLSGVRQLAPVGFGTQVRMQNDSISQAESAGLLVLGAPDQLAPGAAQRLHQCLQDLSIPVVWFEHPQWREPGLLAHWWSTWLQEALPETCAPLPSGGWQGLGKQQHYRLIGVDLCLFSPIEAAFTCLSQAIPIVSLPTASPSSRGVASILSAMGLESLVREQQEEWLQAVGLLVADHDLYQQISSQLIGQCAQSLLCNGELLARDLVAAIDLLRSVKGAAN